MTKDVSSKKAKIDDVIDDYGTDIVITPWVTEVYSDDTGWSVTTSASVTATVVPYDYISGLMNFQEMGNLKEGETRLITKGDLVINQKDTFVYNNITYEVSKVNPLPLAGVNLANVVDGVEQLQ